MKRTFRKLLSLTLCLMMVLGSMAVGGNIALASETEESYKTGDIFEFGSYPQTKETDPDIIAALNELGGDNKDWTSYNYYSGSGSYSDGQMKPSNYMRYKDVTYGTTIYRGVVFDSYRPYYTGFTFSAYNTLQDDNGYMTSTTYWFKYEPIKWRVLDPITGLVLSDAILDSQAYNNYILSSGKDEYSKTAYWGDSAKTYYANNYAKSSIRQWLNNDFCNTAFLTSQQNIIQSTTFDNYAYSSDYSAYDSTSTTDKIFLLSYSDANNSSYGFSSQTSRISKGSDYAKCQGLYVSSGNSYWRLRSAGGGSFNTCYVGYDGNVDDRNYFSTDDARYGVRAALKLNLKSEITLNANNGSEKLTKQTAQNFKSFYPECPAEFTNGTKTFCGWYLDAACQQPWNETDTVEGNMTLYAGWTTYKKGDIIEFGSYPQTDVTSSMGTALNSKASEWKSYGYYEGTGSRDGTMHESDYMYYCDVTYGNNKFRGVKFNTYRPYYTSYASTTSCFTYQDDNGYTVENTYWFKYEPIKWRVLDPATGLVLSETILDSQAYNNYMLYDNDEYWGDSKKTYYANNYAMSSIRQWLNNDFCDTAFLPSQQKIIQLTTFDNYAYSSDYSEYDSVSTTDKIFLLSYSDANNSSYGFSSQTSRISKGSDYAKCQGLYVDSSNGNSYWRLRSAGSYSDGACRVISGGYVDYNYGTNLADIGMRPALKLNLKSDLIRTEISTCMISPITDIKYTGNEICPEITITDGENTLVKDRDYTVAYSNNTNAGTAMVTVTGIEKYKGQTTTVFNITKADQKAPTGITKTDETKCSADDGTILGLTTAMEIAYERGAYAPCTGSELTGLASGSYSVRYAEDSNHNASPSIQIVIQKGACYGGTATCVNKAICDGCKEEYGELGDHDWDDFYTVDTDATYETAGSESIHCKRCTATKDSRSIMSTKEKFEIEKSKEIASLNEFAKEHTSRYSQRIIINAVDEINSYVYDRNISFEGNVQNINAIKDAAMKKVMDRHNFIYGCPFLSFFANILEPVFVCLNRLSSQSGNSVLTEITESIIHFLSNFAC